MGIIFETRDKTGRRIYLTKERQSHICKHPEMRGKIEAIEETLKNPVKITDYEFDQDVRYYYRYYKQRASRAKYLRVIVKYLNGYGFIITAYFVEQIL